jgi:hypothetical protein
MAIVGFILLFAIAGAAVAAGLAYLLGFRGDALEGIAVVGFVATWVYFTLVVMDNIAFARNFKRELDEERRRR